MTTTLDTIVEDATEVVNVLAPFIPAAEALIPGVAQAAAGINLGLRIVQGALALEPKAQALVKQILGGTPLSAAQVQDYMNTYRADDDKLAADLDAIIKKLSPPAG